MNTSELQIISAWTDTYSYVNNMSQPVIEDVIKLYTRVHDIEHTKRVNGRPSMDTYIHLLTTTDFDSLSPQQIRTFTTVMKPALDRLKKFVRENPQGLVEQQVERILTSISV